jgi:hypothetical protein
MFQNSFLKRLFSNAPAGRSIETPAAPQSSDNARCQPVTVLSGLDKEAIRLRYRGFKTAPAGYATVRDFCDSADRLHPLMMFNGDLKDVQRPWTVKAVIAATPPGSRLMEVGGGEPRVAAALAELGYQVTLIDPYDGAGNGPTEYEQYVTLFPNVRIIRERFSPRLPLDPSSFEAVYSISVLEHLPPAELAEVFAAMEKFLVRGGHSIHCADSVIAGNDTEFHYRQLKLILRQQALLAAPDLAPDDEVYDRLLARLASDLETFYLPAQGHHLWRGGAAYDDFPFRKVVSIQSCVSKPA